MLRGDDIDATAVLDSSLHSIQFPLATAGGVVQLIVKKKWIVLVGVNYSSLL